MGPDAAVQHAQLHAMHAALQQSVAATAALEAGVDGDSTQHLAELKRHNAVLEAQLHEIQQHMATAHQQWTEEMDARARRIDRLQGARAWVQDAPQSSNSGGGKTAAASGGAAREQGD